jgi:outer membrane protein
MKKLPLIIATSMLSLFTLSAYADVKIGIVNATLVLQKAPLMLSINNALVKKFKPRQDEIIDAQKKLQQETDQLNLNGATMSQDERSKLQDTMITDKANIDMLSASLQRDLTIQKNQDLQRFSDKLSTVINQIAKNDHYDLIQQTTNVVFVDPKLDITQQVIDQMR